MPISWSFRAKNRKRKTMYPQKLRHSRKNRKPLCLFSEFLKYGKYLKGMCVDPRAAKVAKNTETSIRILCSPICSTERARGNSIRVLTYPIKNPRYVTTKVFALCLITIPIYIESGLFPDISLTFADVSLLRVLSTGAKEQ
jgi:hypothetical protein